MKKIQVWQLDVSFGCFIVETFVELDTFLTSDNFPSIDIQQELMEENNEALHILLEECFTLSETINEIRTSSLPNKIKTPDLSLAPIGIITIEKLQGQPFKRPLNTLYDLGSAVTIINPWTLPKDVTPQKVDLTLNTAGGKCDYHYAVLVEHMTLSELSPTRKYTQPFYAYVSQHTAAYDVILGCDGVLCPAGINTNSSTQTTTWDALMVPWQPKSYFDSKHFGMHVHNVIDNISSQDFDSFFTQPSAQEILESKYDKISTYEVAHQQQNLPQRQRIQLANILGRSTKLFSDKHGCYPHAKVHLEVDKNAQPFRSRPYPVPHAHRAVFQDELNQLEDIGVLTHTGPAKWLSPTFIIPKKDGRVRWVSDFRKLTAVITHNVYNLLRIHDILKHRNGYKYFTKLGISMQYYTFQLDEKSSDLCTITTPFGNYRYNCLPMGIKQLPDIAQQIMEDLFRFFNGLEVYIDYIGIFSNSWEEHVASLEKVLSTLQDNNFTVNQLKCEWWAVQETDWLGYWLTPTGLRPRKKKIQAILAIQRPKTFKELRSFIGAVTIYRDMFPKHSHRLAPSTSQDGQQNIKWTPECESSFNAIKAMLSKDASLPYPDHNKPFHIYTDASDYQLGSVIMQDGKPVAFSSRKLNSAQQKYTTGEKELLSIVETLREYHTMLFGCPELHIYTDHKNLTFQNLQTQCVLHWHLFIEEYSPTFHYIQGKDNSVADALSRLPFLERQNNDSEPFQAQNSVDSSHRTARAVSSGSRNSIESFFSMAIDEDDLLDCFIHLPAQQGIPFQMDFQTISDA
jgi:hypothetical protein